MKSVLVTGCNRGIGLSLIKNLLSLPRGPEHIIATCRSIEKAKELSELAVQRRITILEIDLTKFNEYARVANQVEELTKEFGLNLLINNAGVSSKFTRLPMLKLEQLMDNFVINTAAPLMFTKALLPVLKKAAASNYNAPLGANRAAVINISSVLGSIEQNKDGGFYPYRCSKTALNAATRSMSTDLKGDGILVAAIHPGWCKTAMGGKNAPLETDQATATLLNTIQSLGPDQTGTFLQYDGTALPW